MKQLNLIQQAWLNFRLPTGDVYRKAGDILLLVGVLGGIAIHEFHIANNTVAEVVSFAGLASKFLLNFNAASKPEDIKALLESPKDATN